MKINSEKKRSEGLDFDQQIKTTRKAIPRYPTTTNIKKPPIAKTNGRFKANDAALNDLFAASQQPAKKTAPKIIPPRPKTTLLKSIPKRPRKVPTTSLLENTPLLHEEEPGDETTTIKCPYCHKALISNSNNNDTHQQLPTTLPPILQLELDKIRAAEEQYHQQRMDQQLMDHLPKRRFVSNMDQFRFCQLHQLELQVKPEGIKLGYPIDVDFTALATRVDSLRPELEKVVNGVIDSPYRTMVLAAYNEMGIHKARNTMGVMARFEKTLPGYYGPKGSSVIMNKINDTLLLTGYLTKDKTHPQLPMEYIQQVLVPETGWRLIQQDLIKNGLATDQATMKKAREIMANSVDFGSKMYPVEDEESAYPMELNDKTNAGNDTDTSEDGHDETTELYEYVSEDEQD